MSEFAQVSAMQEGGGSNAGIAGPNTVQFARGANTLATQTLAKAAKDSVLPIEIPSEPGLIFWRGIRVPVVTDASGASTRDLGASPLPVPARSPADEH